MLNNRTVCGPHINAARFFIKQEPLRGFSYLGISELDAARGAERKSRDRDKSPGSGFFVNATKCCADCGITTQSGRTLGWLLPSCAYPPSSLQRYLLP
jgi:hypothetical protein